jgi:hypothetical protein
MEAVDEVGNVVESAGVSLRDESSCHF